MGTPTTVDVNEVLRELQVRPLTPGRGTDRGYAGRPTLSGREGAISPAIETVRVEQILTFVLAGYSIRKISKMTGYAYLVVQKIINNEQFLDRVKKDAPLIHERVREELKERYLTHQQRIDELSEQALDRLEQLIQSEREIVAFKACESILDRNPETPKKHQVDQRAAIAIFDPASLVNAVATAQELEQHREKSGQSGTIIDHATSPTG